MSEQRRRELLAYKERLLQEVELINSELRKLSHFQQPTQSIFSTGGLKRKKIGAVSYEWKY